MDTSALTARELRETIINHFSYLPEQERLLITVVSFGFKNGLPLDADLVFDVRFLPNPHYVESLRALNGNTEEVANYVLKWPVTTRFLSKLYDLMEFLIPYYVQEGKTSLLLGIGCTAANTVR